MFANSALSLIGIVVSLVTINDLRHRYLRAHPGTDSQRLDSVVTTTITIAIGLAVVFLVLYILLALQVRNGKNWARIVTWVFAALGVVGLVNSFDSSATPLSRALSVIQGLIDIVIIVLLALGESNRFFRRSKTPGW